MCGIVGCVGDISYAEERAFKYLLIIDAIRGPHSTGVVQVSMDDKVTYDKKASEPFSFIEESGLFTSRGDFFGKNKLFIGHNRWATVGEINDKNAHPFNHGNIIGVHNGTLTNFYRHLLPSHQKFEVDSENIIYSLDKIGVESTYERLHGAYTLVWYDEESKYVHMIRNNERPLSYVKTDKGNIFFASEAWMMKAVFDKFKIKHGKIESIAVDKLHSIDISNPKKLDMVVGEKLESYQPYYASSTYTGGRWDKKFSEGSDEVFFMGPVKTPNEISPLRPYWKCVEDYSGEEVRVTPTFGEKYDEIDAFFTKYPNGLFRATVDWFARGINHVMFDEVELISEDYRTVYKPDDFKNGTKDLTKTEWEMISCADGCQWCGTTPAFEDRGTVKFLTKDGSVSSKYVCNDCASDPFVLSYTGVF